MKLLILSSDTGEGHNSAAAAIFNAALRAGLTPAIRKPLEESGRINRALGSFYNLLLTKKPQWMTSYLRIIDRFQPNEREFLFRHARPFIHNLLAAEHPDAVLSVHPMLNHFIQRFIKEERLPIPCYTFLTDPFPPFWKGWASPYVDQYFVVRDEAAQALIAEGIERHQITNVRMPVRSQFAPASGSELEKFRQELGLGGDEVILINGGARGGGPLLQVYETVREAAGPANILVVCGRNTQLRTQIDKFADQRTRSFGFLSDLHRYVAAADLVLTKPGAMSTYETMACRVPAILLGICALMPQESGMFHAATQYGFGFSASTFEELKQIIQLGPREWRRRQEALVQFYESSSGQDIIERIQPVHVRA